MGDIHVKDESHLPMSSTTTKAPAGPIIQQSQESEEYQRALQTVVGTALGVILLVGLLALFFLLYRLRRQRHRQRHGIGSQQHSPILQHSTSIDAGKPVPSVLVLYAYDCALHEAVVVALSGLLMEVCGVTVSLDLFEENVILERGLDDWLEDRLQEADYIVVVCSLGARLRCSKKRVRFTPEPGKVLPDYFAVAVDYVAEKLRVERSKGMGVDKFINIVMDYSRLSDVPPQLEAARTYALMRDLNTLCMHLCAASPNLSRKLPGEELVSGDGEREAWKETEAGMELWAALGQARAYFKTHPNWLEDRLQPLPPRPREKPPKRRRRRGAGRGDLHDIPLLPMTVADVNFKHNSSMQLNTVTVSPQLHCMDNENDSRPQQDKEAQLLRARQSSLPASLFCNHYPLPPPEEPTRTVSRSMDSFPPHQLSAGDRDFGEGSTCLLCQQQREGGWGRAGRIHCPLHPQETAVVALSDTDGDSELELGVQSVARGSRTGMDPCSRSKSLPSVGLPQPLTTSTPHLPNSHTAVEGFTNSAALSSSRLSQSRTVLHAEVHKEWDGTLKQHNAKDKSSTFPQQSYKHADLMDLELRDIMAPQSSNTWDVGKVPRMPSDWNTVPGRMRAASPSESSLSDSSCASLSHSGSDSLERDLKSITTPRVFDQALYMDHSFSAFFGHSMLGPAPPRSFSSSVLAVNPDSSCLLRPLPCGIPNSNTNANVPFTIDLSTICLSAEDGVHANDSDAQNIPLSDFRMSPMQSWDV